MAAVATRTCESPGCEQPAKLQCPTCIKLGIHGSFFCSQVFVNLCYQSVLEMLWFCKYRTSALDKTLTSALLCQCKLTEVFAYMLISPGVK